MSRSTTFISTGLAVLFTALIGQVVSHAVQRTPIPRYFEYAMGCGMRKDGTVHQWFGKAQDSDPGENCGLCGEDKALPSSETDADGNFLWRPRDMEYGGKYGRKGPTAVYREGSWMFVNITLWNPHGKYMTWRLCPDATWEKSLNQSCFHYLLKVSPDLQYSPKENATANELKPFVTWDMTTPTQLNVNTKERANGDGKEKDGYEIWVTTWVKLPAGVVCEKCVIQYNYRGRENETFRSCIDIKIIPAEDNAPFDLLESKNYPGMCLSRLMDDTLTLARCDPSDARQSIIGFQSWADFNEKNNGISVNSPGSCLTVLSDTTNSGQNKLVGVVKCLEFVYDNRNNQRWKFLPTNEDKTVFIGSQGGGCLTVGPTDATNYKLFKSTCPTGTVSTSKYGQAWIVHSTPTQDQIPPEFFQNPGREITV